MSLALISKDFFWLMVYSMVGWLYESVMYSVKQRKFVNRGFLNGPYCPIYGFGALIDIIVLGNIENPFLLFLLGALLTCSLEYLTSWAMEKLFHARWWDYSKRRFNIKGRICLLGAVVFGTFSVILIKLVHPFVSFCTDMLPSAVFQILTAVLFVAYLIDTIITIMGFIGFNEKLRAFSDELSKRKENAMEAASNYTISITDKLRETDVYLSAATAYANFVKRINFQERRMIHAFPDLRSVRYNDVLSDLKKRIQKVKDKRRP